MTGLELKKYCSDFRTDKQKDRIVVALMKLQELVDNKFSNEELRELAFFAEPNANKRAVVVWSPNQISKLWGFPSSSTIRNYINYGVLKGEKIDNSRWLGVDDVVELFQMSLRYNL